MQNLTIQLPNEIQRTLEWLSQQEHKSVNELITESLRHYFALTQLQSPALQVLLKAGSDLEDDESMTLAVYETHAQRIEQ